MVQSSPMRRIDLSGQRFGMLLVIGPATNLGMRTRWLVRCDCDPDVVAAVATLHLTSGRQRACGCQRTSTATRNLHRELATKHGHAASTNSAPSSSYKSWVCMWQRCTNPAIHNFSSYGGRGISVCERWRSFDLFLADMGERPEGTSIDRFPARDGNYEPGNCRWATATQQARNRSATKVSPENVREIRVRMSAGDSANVLSKQFNLAPNTIRQINRRETWKDVK